jgi:cytochrome c553
MIFLASAALLAGCSADETTSLNRFAENGRVIAMSGAEAGARNACFTCHGLDGRGDGAGAPRLAGLDAGYLERQLQAYADGRRAHVQMGWIAQRLSGDERKAVAFHYAALPLPPLREKRIPRLPLYHRGDPLRGLPACAACHGEQGQGIGPANPPLAGQPPPYLAGQLDQWQKARRRNDPGDVMLRISQLLSPAEVRSLAAYAARLPGGPPSPESPAASLAARRGDPRSGASGPPLHEPESARAAE